MQLIKDHAIIVDEWNYLDDEAPLERGALVLSLARFK